MKVPFTQSLLPWNSPADASILCSACQLCTLWLRIRPNTCSTDINAKTVIIKSSCTLYKGSVLNQNKQFIREVETIHTIQQGQSLIWATLSELTQVDHVKHLFKPHQSCPWLSLKSKALLSLSKSLDVTLNTTWGDFLLKAAPDVTEFKTCASV